MDISDTQELSRAISEIERMLGIQIDPSLEKRYLAGHAWELPAYEKIQPPTSKVAAIQKFLICARSHVIYRNAVPKGDLSNFYDIYRAGRIVPLVRVLAKALTTVVQKTQNYEPRIERLRKELEIDPFETILYELAVAAKYAEHPQAKQVKFIEETKGTSRSPDLNALIGNREWTVECKKFDRTSDHGAKLRDAMRDLLQPTLAAFKQEQRSAVAELTLKVAPEVVAGSDIASAAVDALRTGRAVISEKYVITARDVSLPDPSKYILYPSPSYFWNQYRHADGAEFQGIVNSMLAKFAGPSYLDEVGWEAAVKWKVVEPESTWRRKKLGYARMLKGLDQLENADNPVLHVCYERDLAIGPRREELLHFLKELAAKKKKAAWIIFNEVVPTVSREGRFDFTEHAHFWFASSSKRADVPSPVKSVFLGDEDIKSDKGEFGVGAFLPSIDEET